ncbi:MAG: phosphatase PAP2 family protein [Clostridia bacterium]|nr:phosphatase PAP2 family protein [Clostridia bacterium]
MRKNVGRNWYVAAGLLAAFVLWTVLICAVDVESIGPGGSRVGFATLNGWVHDATGVHWWLYNVTDWLGLVPFAVAFGFAILGLVQWIRRSSLRKVDRSLWVLGGFYVVVMAAYLFFEVFAVNYRPVLINGVLEISYPSSTTMLALCVMPTAAMQVCDCIKNGVLRRCLVTLIVAFTAFMVIGRLISGVHWVSDIIGGALLSAGLVILYRCFAGLFCQQT